MAESDAVSRDTERQRPEERASLNSNRDRPDRLAVWKARFTEWEPITEFCLAVVAVIVLVLTGFQAWVTNRQLSAMIESNKLAIESAEREQRAYVVALTNDRPLLSYKPASGEYRFEIRVKNSGSTPAHHAVTRMKVYQFPVGDTKGPKYGDGKADPPISIGPDQEFAMIDADELNAEARSYQSEGSHVLWVVGQVDYEDVFRNRHVTKFRFRQTPISAESDPPLQKWEMEIVEVLSD